MPNCRRRFATEPEVKKHIDNHMNPHSSKSRRHLNHMTNEAKNAAAAAQFLTSMDNKANIIPRMGPVVKHELYFPQCYGPPFNQAFGAQQQQAQQGQGQQPQQQPNPAHVQNSAGGGTTVTNGAGTPGTVVTVSSSASGGGGTGGSQNPSTVVAQ